MRTAQNGGTATAVGHGAVVTLDTSRVGRQTLTLLATDNVADGSADARHVLESSCPVLVYSRIITVSCGSNRLEIDTSSTSLTKWASWWLTISRWMKSCGWVTVRLADGREYRIDYELIRDFIYRR